MKINTDMVKLVRESRIMVNSGVKRNHAAEAAAAVLDKPADVALRRVGDRQAGERRMTEALSIAQMAQHVLQRAVEISSRLRNMAIDAMVSRRIDYEGITGLSAELSAALAEYTGRFGMEALPTAALSPKPVRGSGAMKAADGEIRSAFAEMSAVTEDIREGRAVDTSRLDGLQARLKDSFADTEKTVARLTRMGLEMVREYGSGVGVDREYAGMSTVVRESISSDSKAALIAQGNINRETVAALFHA